MSKEFGSLVLAVAVAFAGVMFAINYEPTQVNVTSSDGEVRVVESQLGAFPGPDVYEDIRVHGTLEEGGGAISIDPIDSTYTLTETDMRSNNVITFAASTTQAALTVTLPASTSIPVSREAGAVRTWIIENPFTAAATTTTIAAGTGIDLQEPDGQNVVIGINNYAFLTCFRELSTDVVCKVDETIPGD